MEELFVVLGALVTLVLSIAGMNIYRWRTDVLTGPFISNRDNDLTISDKRTDRLNRATAEKRRKMRAFRQSWNSDPLALDARRKTTGYSSRRPTDLSGLCAWLLSTLPLVKGFYSKKIAGRLAQIRVDPE